MEGSCCGLFRIRAGPGRRATSTPRIITLKVSRNSQACGAAKAQNAWGLVARCNGRNPSRRRAAATLLKFITLCPHLLSEAVASQAAAGHFADQLSLLLRIANLGQFVSGADRNGP
jgi:hypothetical protein